MARLSGGRAPYSFSWSDNSAATDSLRPSLLPGVYAVEVRDSLGCVRRDTMVLAPVEAPPAGLEITFANGVLSVSPGGWVSYQWKRDSVPIPGATSPTYQPVQDGYYSCLVTSANQCSYEPGRIVTGIVSTASPADVEAFTLAPNPASASARLYVRLKQPAAIAWELLDATGRVLYQQRGAGQLFDERLPLDGLPAGLYFVRLTTPAGAAVRTLKVQ